MTMHRLDMELMHKLNLIIRETDARVVVSSSWRTGYSVDFMAGVLYGNGFIGKVIGCTPRLTMLNNSAYIPGLQKCLPVDSVCRGDEILAWYLVNAMSTEAFESIAIIDDDRDMRFFGPRLVHTDTTLGLTDYDVDYAIKLLKTNTGMKEVNDKINATVLKDWEFVV